jgi:uncharacterized membrane protein YphA (DoxX/SURF4 family)
LAVVPAFQARQGHFLVRDQKLPAPLPDQPIARPWSEQNLLQRSDDIVKWGLIAVGIGLLLGLLTRTACVIGALLLLSFYLAIPPLPGWPESPRLEGHYLYINKTLIEVFALLALATTRSGRWFGLDALLQFLRPSSWRAYPLRRPVSLTNDRYPAGTRGTPEVARSGGPHIDLSSPPKEIRHGS